MLDGSMHPHCICTMFSMLVPPPRERLSSGQLVNVPGGREIRCCCTLLSSQPGSHPWHSFPGRSFIFRSSRSAHFFCVDFEDGSCLSSGPRSSSWAVCCDVFTLNCVLLLGEEAVSLVWIRDPLSRKYCLGFCGIMV